MSRLVRLYPRAWRDRYEAELLDLIAQRPIGLRDAVDLVRGAIDAHLHPELVGRTTATGASRRVRPLGLTSAAIGGGGLFIASGLLMNATRIDTSLGYKQVDFAILVLVIGAIATSVAAIQLAWSVDRSRGLRTAAAAMLPLALLIAMPWPVLLIGFLGYGFAAVAFGLLLAMVGSPIIGLFLTVSAFGMLSANTEDERALLLVPFGLAWVALGSLTGLRGIRIHPGPVAPSAT